MSHSAISIALQAEPSSRDARRIAKSSKITCAVWRMENALRPITTPAMAARMSATGFSLPGVT